MFRTDKLFVNRFVFILWSHFQMEENLYTVLNNGYLSNPDDMEPIPGYTYDRKLSSHNQQVYYNPSSNHLIFNVTGTHNMRDLVTDYFLGLGELKQTWRLQEANNVLSTARKTYHPSSVTLTGHSLGGSIASYIGDPQDKIITLNKGATLFDGVQPNEIAYRTEWDVPSLLLAGNQHVITLKNPRDGHYDAIMYAHTINNLL